MRKGTTAWNMSRKLGEMFAQLIMTSIVQNELTIGLRLSQDIILT